MANVHEIVLDYQGHCLSEKLVNEAFVLFFGHVLVVLSEIECRRLVLFLDGRDKDGFYVIEFFNGASKTGASVLCPWWFYLKIHINFSSGLLGSYVSRRKVNYIIMWLLLSLKEKVLSSFSGEQFSLPIELQLKEFLKL